MMVNGDAKKVLAGLVTAGVIGAWGFAATRASSQDIESVRNEIKEVESEAKDRHTKLSQNVEEIKETIQEEAVEAASFRAQVRTALRIREE